MYWVIHLTKTDGEIVLQPCKNGDEIESYLEIEGLYSCDYSIIKGDCIKTEDDTFDYKKLKGEE